MLRTFFNGHFIYMHSSTYEYSFQLKIDRNTEAIGKIIVQYQNVKS